MSAWGGVCFGGVWSRGVPGPGGVSVPGGLVVGVAWSRGGLLLGGCLLPGGVVSQHALRQTPPVDRITDTCKNITLAQLRCGR